MRFKKIWISIFISLMLAGCTDAQVNDLIAYVQLWAIANDYTTSDGELDTNRLMIMLLSGGDVDPGESAVLNQTKNVQRIKIANDYAREGFSESDPEKLEEAMRQRPEEYGFQAQYVVVSYTDIQSFTSDLDYKNKDNMVHFQDINVFVDKLSQYHMDEYPEGLIKDMEKTASKQSAEDLIKAHHVVINSALLKNEQMEEVLKPSIQVGGYEGFQNYLVFAEEKVRFNYTVYQSWQAIADLTQNSADRDRVNRTRETYMKSYEELRKYLAHYFQSLYNPA